MIVMCYSEDTFKLIESHLLKKGYKWREDNLGDWYIDRTQWYNGRSIEFREKHIYLDSYAKLFNSKYDIIDKDYIKKYIYGDFNIGDVVSMFDEI